MVTRYGNSSALNSLSFMPRNSPLRLDFRVRQLASEPRAEVSHALSVSLNEGLRDLFRVRCQAM